MEQPGLSKFTKILSLACTSLVQARIMRQEADLDREFDLLYEVGPIGRRGADKKYETAKKFRLLAKEALQELEKLNGRWYSRGQPIIPLKKCFNGRLFREWGEYAHQYKYNRLFCGSDPE